MYSKELILTLLKEVFYKKINLVEKNYIKDLVLQDSKIVIVLDASRLTVDEFTEIKELIQQQLLKQLHSLVVDNIQIIFSKEKSLQPVKSKIEHVNKIILVVSGKGGVGKSTVASGLALELSKYSNIGLLDADIYGPSIPYIFRINQKPHISENNRIKPLHKLGINLVSMGFLVDENQPIVWRGPMITKAIYQLTHGVDWRFDGQDLNFLIIDTPPGTGDIHLTLATKYLIDGVIFVTTPQLLAIKDTVKSINMFAQFEIPIIGVVENMSYLRKQNGVREEIFGANLLKINGLNFLARLPLSKSVAQAEQIDNGIYGLSDEFCQIALAVKTCCN